MREFDVSIIKSEQIDNAKNMVSGINVQWEELRLKLEEKLKFCRQIHRKHNTEVENYEELEELFDQSKFKQKVKKSISKLHGEQTKYEMSVQQAQSEVDQLKVFNKRLDRDLEQLNEENVELKQKRKNVQEENLDQQSQRSGAQSVSG